MDKQELQKLLKAKLEEEFKGEKFEGLTTLYQISETVIYQIENSHPLLKENELKDYNHYNRSLRSIECANTKESFITYRGLSLLTIKIKTKRSSFRHYYGYDWYVEDIKISMYDFEGSTLAKTPSNETYDLTTLEGCVKAIDNYWDLENLAKKNEEENAYQTLLQINSMLGGDIRKTLEVLDLIQSNKYYFKKRYEQESEVK